MLTGKEYRLLLDVPIYSKYEKELQVEGWPRQLSGILPRSEKESWGCGSVVETRTNMRVVSASMSPPYSHVCPCLYSSVSLAWGTISPSSHKMTKLFPRALPLSCPEQAFWVRPELGPFHLWFYMIVLIILWTGYLLPILQDNKQRLTSPFWSVERNIM